VSQNVSSLRSRRATVRSANGSSVDAMTHAYGEGNSFTAQKIPAGADCACFLQRRRLQIFLLAVAEPKAQ